MSIVFGSPEAAAVLEKDKRIDFDIRTVEQRVTELDKEIEEYFVLIGRPDEPDNWLMKLEEERMYLRYLLDI